MTESANAAGVTVDVLLRRQEFWLRPYPLNPTHAMDEERYSAEEYCADNHEGDVQPGRSHRQLIRRKKRHQKAEHHANKANSCDQPHPGHAARYAERAY